MSVLPDLEDEEDVQTSLGVPRWGEIGDGCSSRKASKSP